MDHHFSNIPANSNKNISSDQLILFSATLFLNSGSACCVIPNIEGVLRLMSALVHFWLILSFRMLLLAYVCGIHLPLHLSHYFNNKYVITFFIYVYIFTNYSFIIFIYHHKPCTSPNQRFVILFLLVSNRFLLSVELTVFYYYYYSLFFFICRMGVRKGSFRVMSVCTIRCLSSSPASAKAAPHVC